MIVQARLCTVEGKGIGWWRNYFTDCEDLRDASWFARDLVPKCQVRVKDGREVVFGPCRAEELQAVRGDWPNGSRSTVGATNGADGGGLDT
jgi:hypothetical protein